MTVTIIDALASLRPGMAWTVDGESYDGIRDKDANTPTEQEVLDEITRLEALEVSEASRLQDMKDDARALKIIAQLQTKTNQQIDTYIDGANMAELKVVLAGILKVLAYKWKVA